MNPMNARPGCNCSGDNGMNYRNSMSGSKERCEQNNCGMRAGEMEKVMHRCRHDSAQSCNRDPLFGMPLAMGYVPWQRWGKIYDISEGLSCGTIFPELNLPFLGCIPKGCGAGKGGRL